MPGCSAFGCSNRSENGFRLFRFPSDSTRRDVWAARLRRDQWTPTRNNHLCEVHFDDDQFEANRADGRRLLKVNAVPTIFSYRPLYKRQRLPLQRVSEEFSSKATLTKRVKTEHSYHRPCQTIQEPNTSPNWSTVFITNSSIPVTEITLVKSSMDDSDSQQMVKREYSTSSSSLETALSTIFPVPSSSSSLCNNLCCLRKNIKLHNLQKQYWQLNKAYNELKSEYRKLQKKTMTAVL